MTVVTGQRAVLSCESTGIPAPQVSWKRNGSPLNVDLQSGAYRFEAIFEMIKNYLYIFIVLMYNIIFISYLIYLLTNTDLI